MAYSVPKTKNFDREQNDRNEDCIYRERVSSRCSPILLRFIFLEVILYNLHAILPFRNRLQEVSDI